MYEASTLLVVASSQKGAATNDPIMSQLGALTASRNVATQVEIVGSPDNLTEAFSQFTVKEQNEGFGPTVSNSARRMPPLWSYRIENKPETDVITVTATSYSPEVAARFANQITRTYLSRDLTNNNATNRAAREFIQRQLGETGKKLAAATAHLANIKRNTTLVSPDGQLLAATQRVYLLKSSVDIAIAGLESSASRMAEIDHQLNQTKEFVPFSSQVQQNPLYAQVASRISSLQGQRAQLVQDFTAESIEVRNIDNTIRIEREDLKHITENILFATMKQANPVWSQLALSWATEKANEVALSAQLAASNRIMENSQSQLLKFPAMARQVDSAARAVAILDQTYTQLSNQYYTFLINENSNVPSGLIVSEARPKFLPVYPKVVPTLILVTIVGFILAVGLALAIDKLDARIHDPAMVEKLTGLVTLSGVPNVAGPDTGNRPIIGSDIGNGHAFLESYRILRNNISFASPDKPIHIIAVTSAGRAEGKTTTSANLAISMGMDGRRVLLIDGDLRRPSLHTVFGIPREIGFTSVVRGQVALEDAIVPTIFDNVFCLPSGPIPPDSTEFLNSEHSRRIVEEASKLYDMVIVDSPPSSGLSDIQVISTFVDGIVLVVSLEGTLRPQLQSTMLTLKQAGAKMLGTVVNRVELKRPGYGYYYSYYYYYQYEEDSKAEGRRGRSKRKRRRGGKGKD